jgi:hypothetical protein
MSKAASSEKTIVSAFIALHGNIPVNIADYHQPKHTFIFNINYDKLPPRYNLYAPDNLGRSYTLSDPNTADYISKKIEEWIHSPLASGKVSPRSRSRPAIFSEFISGELTDFEKTDAESLFKDIDDIYKELPNGRMSKELKEEIGYMRTEVLLKNEINWKKHDYYIVEKIYSVSGPKVRHPDSKTHAGKEIIVVIETIRSDGTRDIKRHNFILKSLPSFGGSPGLAEIAGCLISEYSLSPTDEINFFDFTCSVITFPKKLYGLGQYNMNLLSSNRNPDGSAKLTFGTITKKRSFDDAFGDGDGDDDDSPSAGDSASSMKVHRPRTPRSSLSSPKHSPADHKSPYSPPSPAGPTIEINVPKELVSYVSFTGHRQGGGSVRRKYTRRKQYTKKTRP